MQLHLIPYYGSTHSGPLGVDLWFLFCTPLLHNPHCINLTDLGWHFSQLPMLIIWKQKRASDIHIYPTKLENLALEQIGLSDFMHKGQTLLSRIIGIASHTTISGTLPTLPNFSICECEFTIYTMYNADEEFYYENPDLLWSTCFR